MRSISQSDRLLGRAWPPACWACPRPLLHITRRAPRSPPPRRAAPGPQTARSRRARVITGEFDTSLEGGYVLLPFRRARRAHGGARALLPRPARGADQRAHQARAGPRALRGAPGARRALGHGRVPRLGRLQPSRRHGLAQRLLERGRLPRQPEAAPSTAGRRAASCPGRSRRGMGGRAGRGGGRLPARGRRATARWPGGSRSTPATDPLWESDPYLPAPYDETPAALGARAGTPGTSTCTPSTPRSATRRCARRSTTRSPRWRATAAVAREPGAGLDFITLSDYVTELRVGRGRPLPGRLSGQADRRAARRSSPTRGTRTITPA